MRSATDSSESAGVEGSDLIGGATVYVQDTVSPLFISLGRGKLQKPGCERGSAYCRAAMQRKHSCPLAEFFAACEEVEVGANTLQGDFLFLSGIQLPLHPIPLLCSGKGPGNSHQPLNSNVNIWHSSAPQQCEPLSPLPYILSFRVSSASGLNTFWVLSMRRTLSGAHEKIAQQQEKYPPFKCMRNAPPPRPFKAL